MSLRNVAGIVTINGTKALALSLSVNMTKTQSSDTMNATLALSSLPASLGAAFWLSAAKVDVSAAVVAGADGGHLFEGEVDGADIDWTANVVSISARDKSSGTIDHKSTEDFRNKSASDIVREIASRRGLKPVVDETGGKAGKIYQIDWVKLTDHVSEWSLIQHLADREGKVAFVTKNELHFKDLDDDSLGEIKVTFVPPQPGARAIGVPSTRLSVRRDFQLGKGTKVKVQSWNTKQKEAYTAEEERPGAGGEPNEYHYSHPGLTEEQTRSIAKKRLREHTRHEMEITLDMPGSARITPNKRLTLSGTGTAADQTYYIDSANHEVSGDYTVSITAKNSKGGK